MANGAYSYHPTVYYLLDCAPSLDVCVTEVESGLAFVRRTGNEEAGQWLDSCRRLAAVLRGESAAPADEAVPIDRYADNPLALLHAHLGGAIAAAIFGDLDGLARHAAAAIPLLPAALGLYPTAVGRLLHGLALAGQARMTNGDEHLGHRRPNEAEDRTGPARWRPAATGLPRPAPARGAGGCPARTRRAGHAARPRRRRGRRRARGPARDRPRYPPGDPGPGRSPPRPQDTRPPLPHPRRPADTCQRAAPGTGRGQRLLYRRPGTDQRGQARPRLIRQRRGQGRR